jgi:hypothetical protein
VSIPAPPLRTVGRAVAGEGVVVIAAGEVLDGDQGVGTGAAGGLGSGHGQADGDACRSGHPVGVGNGVDAGAAVEDVVADAGVEHVVEGVAGEVGGTVAKEAAVLDVGPQGVAAQSAVYRVGAAGAGGGVGFADEVAQIPDVVGIRAVAAGHRVDPCAAIEDVGCAVAGEAVGVGGSGEVLDAE